MNINMLLSSNKGAGISTSHSVGTLNMLSFGFSRRQQLGRLNPDITSIIEFSVRIVGNGIIAVELAEPSPTGKITFSIYDGSVTFYSKGTTFSKEAQSSTEKSLVSVIRNNYNNEIPLVIMY